MAVIAFSSRALRGHDFGPPLTGALAIFYIVIDVIYTGLLVLGLFCLYLYRHHTAVRIRNFSAICSSVLSIHCYLALIPIAYPLNGLWKCGAEFWIMNVALPLGMGLFQASNIRLLSYYDAQQSITAIDSLFAKKRRLTWSPHGLWRWWNQQSLAMKTYIGIGIGFVIQLIVAFVLFFGSRRYHASYGFFSDHVGAGECRRGFEWLPSVFWQFLWSWVFGPMVLVKIRNIQDVHNWAWETKIAILASLPGTPLWLAFTYSDSPAVASINKYFIPPGWFMPGLVTLQVVSVYCPLREVYKGRNTAFHKVSNYDEKSTTSSSSSSTFQQKRDFYTMSALDLQIQKNIDPLLKWAAQKDFTAENVVFLREVRDWKRKWERNRADHTLNHGELYEEAGLIFFTLVHPLTAKFNINIDFRTYQELAATFNGLSYEPFEDDASSSSKSSRTLNDVTPWADPTPAERSPSEGQFTSDVDKLYPLPVTEISVSDHGSAASFSRSASMGTRAASVPHDFGIHVFNRAYQSVKKDVFLNTWMKFLDSADVTSV